MSLIEIILIAVGITFAFFKINIFKAVLIIGLTTFFISMGGVKVGSLFGTKYKAKAEFAGGAVLIILGIKGINTAGQALQGSCLRNLQKPTAAFRGKPRGIEPFVSSLAQPCPYKHGRSFAPLVNKSFNRAFIIRLKKLNKQVFLFDYYSIDEKMLSIIIFIYHFPLFPFRSGFEHRK